MARPPTFDFSTRTKPPTSSLIPPPSLGGRGGGLRAVAVGVGGVAVALQGQVEVADDGVGVVDGNGPHVGQGLDLGRAAAADATVSPESAAGGSRPKGKLTLP